METIFSLDNFQEVTQNSSITVIYFSSETCNVCKVLKPKIRETLATKFPGVKLYYVDIEKSPVISGQQSIFSIPTIEIYVEGKHHARFSRNVTLHEFEAAIQKPFEILFEE